MPKYVVQMGKEGSSETYQILDKTARQAVATEAAEREAAISAEATARQQAIGAGDAAVLAQIAPVFAAGTAYTAGQYVTYEGVVYRLTADHAAGTTWANTQKAATNLGQETSDLNRAIKDPTYGVEYGGISESGVKTDTANRIRSGYIRTTTNGVTFTAATGYSFMTYFYNNAYEYTARQSWANSVTISSINAIIRFVLRKGDGTEAITTSEFFTAFSSGLEYTECLLRPIDLEEKIGSELIQRDLLIADNDKTITNLYNEQYSIPKNLFDINSTLIQKGKYTRTGSTWYTPGTADPRVGTTHPIFVKKGIAYKTNEFSGIYGATYAAIVSYVDVSDNLTITKQQTGTILNGYLEFTAEDSGYIVVNIDLYSVARVLFCESSYFPAGYVPYYGNSHIPVLSIASAGNIRNMDAMILSPNLFNKNSEDIQTTRYIGKTNWVTKESGEHYNATHPIFMESGKTYRYTKQTRFGNGSFRVVRLSYPEGMEILEYLTGTETTTGYVDVTPTVSGYYATNLDDRNYNSFMLCEIAKFPSEYEPYGALRFCDNVVTSLLYGKVMACDGDSICNATSDHPEEIGGWFGRFVRDDFVTGENYSVNGATITAETYSQGGSARHWICRSIDTIYSKYPELDYLILEGGTNDADNFGRFIDDTPPEGFGTWSETDYSGNYDDTTFCGAVDTLFYKAVTYFPETKIGYLVPMEMGNSLNQITNRKRYFDEAIKIAKKWHIPVLNLWDNSGVDARLAVYYDPEMTVQENIDAHHFYQDGQHPTSYGYNKLQNKIATWVKGL